MAVCQDTSPDSAQMLWRQTALAERHANLMSKSRRGPINHMIPYNFPAILGAERDYIQQALKSGKMSGDGAFPRQCERWIEEQTDTCKALMVPSCTAGYGLQAYRRLFSGLISCAL